MVRSIPASSCCSSSPRTKQQADLLGKGVVWGGLAITFLTLIFRIASRLRGFKRLWWDDAVVVLAWLMLLGNAILWQLAKKGLYVLAQVQSGQELPPADFAAQVERYLRLSSGNLVLFYTTLWSVKLSFLIFFRRLGHNVNRQNVIWWTVFGVVAAGYITVIGTIQWNCLLRSFQTISGRVPFSSLFFPFFGGVSILHTMSKGTGYKQLTRSSHLLDPKRHQLPIHHLSRQLRRRRRHRRIK